MSDYRPDDVRDFPSDDSRDPMRDDQLTDADASRGAASDEHPWAAMAPAYALGAPDEAERAYFAAHLAGCAACAEEVRAYGDVAAGLARALPPVTTPDALRARIVEAARRDERARTFDAARRSEREAPAVAPPVAAGDEPAVPIDRARRASSGPAAPLARRGAPTWLPWLAAAASFAVAVALGSALRGERRARALADAEVRRARADVAARDAQVAERDALLAAITAPDVRTARLTATGAAPEVRVVWNRARGVVLLTAQALPAVPAGRTYQLWGIPSGGAPRSLGLFVPGADGRARAVLRVPAGVALDIAAITEEPAGGSPAPTMQPILLGPLTGE